VRELQAAGGTPLSGDEHVGKDAEPSAGGAGSPAGRAGHPAGRRRVAVLLAVAVTVLALDIASKTVVVATLSDRAPVRLLWGFLHLTESRNPGAAFSIGTSMTVVFSAIAVGVIVYILRTSRRIRNLPWAVTLGLLLGGATGNLMDRLFRYPGPFRGYVVDWIQVPHFPIFNLADSSIVCGGVLAVLLAIRGVSIEGPSGPGPHGQPPGASAGTAGETGRDSADTSYRPGGGVA